MQGFQRNLLQGYRLQGHLKNSPAISSLLFVFSFLILILFLGAFVSTHLFDTSVTSIARNAALQFEYPLSCLEGNLTRTCPANYYPAEFYVRNQNPSSTTPTCPDYFRWIHDDLRPWRDKGITKEMVEKARRTANFRLVIVKGRAYIERYVKAFQTRDDFTLWGILQLLRRYPGQVPDLDLMFDCVDWPVIRSVDYTGPKATAVPPLFRYCGDEATLDIVFPDWTFWGWPETNIKPWDALLRDLNEGNKRRRWLNREPYAYWRGNPNIAANRMDLIKCNVSDKQDWNARLYIQDWTKESKQGYKQSDLASQCNHRYKIYIEGSAWSVSEKYILACDSVTFLIKPQYYDFFTRSLIPVYHYWPIRNDTKCKSIKFAVDWCNHHKQKAQDIGKTASGFVQKELKMEYVYDYMFHLLNEYAKLLTYKPAVPEKATELCSETMACPANGLEKKFMTESMVKGPTYTSPCKMQPPNHPTAFNSLLRRKANIINKVESWERSYWELQNKHN
ncbi:uncharacterized protein LOC132312644 isoform X2 [Cornus florida]|nr:uncharacterized protein LOC132312644 isoform X2 [Cornus florida]